MLPIKHDGHHAQFKRGETDMKTQNSVVFVTGANRGFGLAVAREALARGASKVYAGMRNTEGFSVPGLTPVRIDVTDPASIAAAAARAGDVTLLVNNAGIGRIQTGPLDPKMEQLSREIFETNYYGMIRASQAFAPILGKNGGGAIINVLSIVTWTPSQVLAAYAASKSAAWAFTNALRLELEKQHTQVLGLHVGFMDTDLTRGVESPKVSPVDVARLMLDDLAAGKNETFGDAITRSVKEGLSAERASYFDGGGLS
jgi:NAD(P)-dependent dehydrogenase (short-subunit alcohol dehydrogenase family)